MRRDALARLELPDPHPEAPRRLLDREAAPLAVLAEQVAEHRHAATLASGTVHPHGRGPLEPRPDRVLTERLNRAARQIANDDPTFPAPATEQPRRWSRDLLQAARGRAESLSYLNFSGIRTRTPACLQGSGVVRPRKSPRT
jgi:hypothetical protein